MWSKHLNVSISVHEFLEPRNIAVLWRGIHLETRPAERTFVYAIQQTAGVGHFRVVRQRRVHAHAQEFLSAIDVRNIFNSLYCLISARVSSHLRTSQGSQCFWNIRLECGRTQSLQSRIHVSRRWWMPTARVSIRSEIKRFAVRS